MSFWTRWPLKKFNPNHGDDGRFAEVNADQGKIAGTTFDEIHDGMGNAARTPDPRDDKMAVLQALLDKAKLAQAQVDEAKHPNHYELEDFVLADDEA
jgi:hypothetical protein